MLQPRRRTARLMLAAALVMALGAASCGDDDDDDTPGTGSTSPSTDSTTTTLSPEEEVKAAYLAFADMGARLLQDPNPDDPEIAQRTSGEAQGDLIDGLTTLRSMGQRYELGPHYKQDVLSVEFNETTATAKVCVVDDVRLLDGGSGATLGQGTTTARWIVTMLRSGQTWLVDRIVETELGEGVVPCG